MRYVEPFLGGGAVFLSMLPGSPLPFLRWAGGKRKLVGEVRKRLGLSVAGEAVRLLDGSGAGITDYLVADVNPDLVAAWRAVRDDVEPAIGWLREQPRDVEGYTQARAMLYPSNRGARAIYLNLFAHAGLWRTNRKGEYNVPPDPARFASVDIDAVAAHLRLISPLLSRADIRCQDFRATLRNCGADSLVYVDPPYLPDGDASKFTSYTSTGFTRQDTIDLARACAAAVDRGARVVISNSVVAMPIFAEAATVAGVRFQGDTVQARRSIGVGKGRAETPRQVGEMMTTMWRE